LQLFRRDLGGASNPIDLKPEKYHPGEGFRGSLLCLNEKPQQREVSDGEGPEEFSLPGLHLRSIKVIQYVEDLHSKCPPLPDGQLSDLMKYVRAVVPAKWQHQLHICFPFILETKVFHVLWCNAYMPVGIAEIGFPQPFE
jgi:hypothetical protein